jgi:hypothetical protein
MLGENCVTRIIKSTRAFWEGHITLRGKIMKYF